MWAILFWLGLTAVVAIERLLYLAGSHQDTDVFIATLHQCLLGTRNVEKAIAMCLAARSPLGRIIMRGLRSLPDFQKGCDEAALRELPKITKRIGYFAVLANLSMLTGLFGTIVGLIKAFGAVGGESIDHAAKSRILAEGISEAMNCTAFGLLAAIIALVAYSFFTGWANNLEDSMHRESVHVGNLVKRVFKDD